MPIKYIYIHRLEEYDRFSKSWKALKTGLLNFLTKQYGRYGEPSYNGKKCNS